MATEVDNLDARMETIRLKNEELEKKHKEIMEDEELAKKQNAIVDVKVAGRDIPTSHPYDHVDLDFDVKDSDKELAKNPNYKPKERRPQTRKELLNEIPDDPVNFLRREDDDEKPKGDSNQNHKTGNRNNRNNRNRQERPRQERSNNERSEANNSGESPPRQRNQNQRPREQRPQHQQQSSSPQDGNSVRKPPQQLRTERRTAPDQSPKHSQPNRHRRPHPKSPNKEGAELNNLTVQISDGEVRSVKLKSSEKTFGTGRVGHSRNENIQKFTVDTFDPENVQDKSPQDKPRHRNQRNNHNRRNQKPKEFQHPTLENIIVSKTSVQERLLKIAKDKQDDVEPVSNVTQSDNTSP
ncbi:CLUMA_CG014339, isoform A [Clunio marinus]|uniref:CLUMA_CG014339, isoform A n=1 Tax=Clunio marinus TaxID=568069 RepID=A0A1J1IMA3_9DIPT|nr:CLUMA_CG014339, isoform A [Clunio marinus]